jgi:YVTN family beta-propeller protein
VPISLNSSRLRRFSLAGVLFALLLLWAGCQDTYRPIANPILAPGGDPQTTHYAIVVNSNDGLATLPAPPPGGSPVTVGPSVTQIDVSGDTNIGNHVAGLNPVHAALSPALNIVYVVNQGDNTVTTYAPGFGVGATVSTIPLLQNNSEPNADASYVAVSNSYAFVAESALNRVAIVNSTSLNVQAFVPVGVNPVSVACTADGRKAYVVNQGSNSVSVISTRDNTNTANIPVGSSPGPITISADNNYIFVGNEGDGTVSVIDTNSDTVTNTLTVGSDPTQVVWDNGLKRLYVVNTGAGSITIVDASAFPQKVLKTVTTSANPVAVAPLDDGSKFYVLFLGNPGFIEVYDAQGYYKRTTITVDDNALPNGLPALNQVLLAAAPGSTKVYAVNYNGVNSANPNITGSTSIIHTLDDTVELNLPSPSPHPTFVVAQ